MSGWQRLDRLLAGRGFGSRKEIRSFARAGRITVDAAEVRDVATLVDEDTAVCVDGKEVVALPLAVVWHKPLHTVSTYTDPLGREGLENALPEGWAGLLHPVGRLDAETTGLLLFSRSGALTQWLLHPRRAIERVYEARVEGRIEEGLVARLAAGVETTEGVFPATVETYRDDWLRLVVTEGKHRMVRRILANAGHPVQTLHRVRYGGFALGDLVLEEARPVSAEEHAWLAERRAPLD